MSTTFQMISLPLPFRMGFVNVYLLKTPAGFFLVDSGSSSSRQLLIKELKKAGCQPGNLNLILLTHGDFDHTGNAAYLRSTYSCKIALHPADAGMAEQGDMFANRQKPNFLIRQLIPILSGFGKAERFSPDLSLSDGLDLNPYGLDARVISIPGHSKGSIAVLTADGDMFCGDLLENIKAPMMNSIMDDPTAARASLKSILKRKIRLFYPGHGQSFGLDELIPNLPTDK